MPFTRRRASAPGASRCLLTIAAFLAVVWLGAACSGPEPSLEERARALDRQLICPICPGSTIDQSSVQVSKDMRRIVREKLEAGESEQQIKDYFVERYGPFVLAAPPQTGFNVLAWVIPGTALAVGAVALAFILRAMRSRARTEPSRMDRSPEDGESAGAELAPFLRAVDADLQRDTSRHQVGEKGGE